MSNAAAQPADRILRFGLADRLEHLSQLVVFVGLAVTGLIQKYFEAGFSKWIIEMLGGLENTRNLHRVMATILMLAVVYHLGKVLHRTYVQKRPRAMIPGKADWVALKGTFAYLIGRADEPPPEGRFTFAEKVEYWAFVWGTMLMVVTGYMLWNPITTAKFLPGDFIPAAKAAHGGEALLAVLAIIVWHLYHVHIKHFNTSIFTGYMSREQMIEEHRLELEAIEIGRSGPQASVAEMARRQIRFFPAFSAFAILMFGLTYWFVTYEETSLETIEPIEQVEAFKPLPPETDGHFTPPLSESNPFPSTTIPSTIPTEQPPPSDLSWIEPIGFMLGAQCGSCHSASSTMGGLDLSAFEAMMASEGVVEPGSPQGSSLITVQEAGGHPGQLAASDLAVLEAWIEAGAPKEAGAASASWDSNIASIVILRCGACHSDAIAAGGVDLSTYQAALSGSAIVAGDGPASPMYQVQASGGHAGLFLAEELELVKTWIDEGAKEK